MTKKYYNEFINKVINEFKEYGTIEYFERCILAYILELPDDDRIDEAIQRGIKEQKLIRILDMQKLKFKLDPVMF